MKSTRFFFLLALAGMTFAQSQPESFQKTLPLKSGGLLEVRNGRGSTTLDGWDKNEVKVDVVKHFERGDEGQRARWMQETTVDFEASADRVAVKVHTPNNFCVGWCDYNAWVDLTIHAPKNLQADVDNDRGKVHVADINGDLRLRVDRGNVDVQRVTGGVSIRTDRTPVALRDVVAQQSVDISVERADLDMDNVALNKGGTLSAGRGSIRARLAGNVGLNVDVDHDRRSSFHSDFPMTTSGNIRSGSIHGSINGGGPTLRLRGERASISLERARGSL